MTWVEKRMADVEALRQKNAAIREQAIPIYDALWEAITSHLFEAKDKGLGVSVNGSLQKRTVMLAKQNNSSQDFELELTLVDAKTRIRAHGDRVDLTLILDVCPDGVVCVKLGAQVISVEDAAIRILDPFLFPQLQG